jgi:hypothetical protein
MLTAKVQMVTTKRRESPRRPVQGLDTFTGNFDLLLTRFGIDGM